MSASEPKRTLSLRPTWAQSCRFGAATSMTEGPMRTLPLRPTCGALPPFDLIMRPRSPTSLVVPFKYWPARAAGLRPSSMPSSTPTAAGAARPHVRSGTRQPAPRGASGHAATELGAIGGPRLRCGLDQGFRIRARSVGRHPTAANDLVERFFNQIKHCRRVATRYNKLAANLHSSLAAGL